MDHTLYKIVWEERKQQRWTWIWISFLSICFIVVGLFLIFYQYHPYHHMVAMNREGSIELYMVDKDLVYLGLPIYYEGKEVIYEVEEIKRLDYIEGDKKYQGVILKVDSKTLPEGPILLSLELEKTTVFHKLIEWIRRELKESL